MYIQIMGRDSLVHEEEPVTLTGRYYHYMTQFASLEPTPGVTTRFHMKKGFYWPRMRPHQSNEDEKENLPNIMEDNGTLFNIVESSHALVYEPGAFQHFVGYRLVKSMKKVKNPSESLRAKALSKLQSNLEASTGNGAAPLHFIASAEPRSDGFSEADENRDHEIEMRDEDVAIVSKVEEPADVKMEDNASIENLQRILEEAEPPQTEDVQMGEADA